MFDTRYHPLSSKISLWGALSFIAFLYGMLSWVTPYYLDDWVFMSDYISVTGSSEFSLSGWSDYYFYIRSYDNGRFSNLMLPIFTLYAPTRCLFPIITGIAMAYIIYIAGRLTSSHAKRPAILSIGLSWILLLVFLPWRDTMFVADYSLNYIWSAALTLLFLQLLLSFRDGRPRFIKLISTLFVGFLAAGWHESFAFTTIFGLLCLLLLRRFKVNTAFLAVAGFYLLTAIIVGLSPGLIHRFFAEYAAEHSIIQWRPKFIANFFVGIILAMVICLLCLSGTGRKTLRKLFLNDFCVTASGICISGYLLAFNVNPTPRSFFWPDLCSVALLLALLFNLRLYGRLRNMSIFLGVILMAVCIAQTMATIFWQLRYDREYDYILSQLESSDSGTAFADIIPPGELPYYTLKIPVQEAWINKYYYAALREYFEKPRIGVVPEILRRASLADITPFQTKIILKTGEKVNMQAGIFENQVIAGNDPRFDRLWNYDAVVSLKNGEMKETNVLVIPFVPEKKRNPQSITDSDDMTILYFRIPDVNVKEIDSLTIFDK